MDVSQGIFYYRSEMLCIGIVKKIYGQVNMKQITQHYNKHKNIYLMLLGLLLTSLVVLPCVFLGEGSYVEVHDQLDGEVLNYIYRAKYLFQGNNVPEFMNGMSKAAMAMPAPFGVFFYRLLPPFVAFTLMQWMGVLVGFAGMFNLCRHFRVKSEISFAVALLFAFMPFYPVYGLAAYGQPLLVLCMIQITEEKKHLSSAIGIVLYAGFSSLTLVGYVWVVLGFVYVCFLLTSVLSKRTIVNQKYKNAEGQKQNIEKLIFTAVGWTTLMFTYIVTNLELIASVLGKGFESHRSEMVLNARNNVFRIFTELFFKGGAYNKTYSVVIFAAVILLSTVLLGKKIMKSTNETKSETDLKDATEKTTEKATEKATIYIGNMETIKVIWCMVGGIALLTTLSVLWNIGPIVSVRNAIGGIVVYFQADRVYWIFPFLWMVVLALVLQMLFDTCKKQTKAFVRVGAVVIALVVLFTEGVQILRDSTLNKNIRLLFVPGYSRMTWESFYMDDVFTMIEEAIGEENKLSDAMAETTETEASEAGRTVGTQKSVISLGMYPSIALYHGYTCADGYSNNYELSYKHDFRKIFAKELDQSPEMQSYFDDWGNRLYVADADYGFNTLMQKGSGLIFKELDFDVEAMKELNIGYVFSAAPIENAEDMGLVLIDETPFSTDTSYYEVWVYEVQ